MRTAGAAVSFLALLAITAVLLSAPRAAGEADAPAPETGGDLCSPLGLVACRADLARTGKVTRRCCDSLIAIEPCLCSFLKDPTLKELAKSIFDKLITRICGLKSVTSQDACAA